MMRAAGTGALRHSGTAVRVLGIAVPLCLCAAAPLSSQCPDGTPPPCRAVRAPARSIAVLPFASLGEDTANTYFAQGLADELTTALARVPGLKVAASTSAFTFGSGVVDPRRVGRELRVATVLQGRVRREGSRLRVVAQLTDATNGLVLWSNSYEREVRDVFAVQDDLTRDIVAQLRGALTGERPAPPANAGTGAHSIEAYDLYLRGLYFLTLRGGGVARSIPYFQQAIARDSTFARAWAQLGTAWAVYPLYGRIAKDSALRQARLASDQALRLDPSSAEAHAASGMTYLLDNDGRRAAAELERAIALDSTYTFAHRPYVSALAMLGRTDDAIAQGRRAIAIDPLSSVTAAVYSMALVVGRRYDEAVAVARRGVELDSLSPLGVPDLALAQYFAGDVAGARETARHAVEIPNTSMQMAFLAAATGDHPDVPALVRRIEQERDGNANAEMAIAFAWLGAGDTTQALDALERMAARHEPVSFQGAFNHPAYDPVRQSARFAAVVRSYGLDPALFTRTPVGARP
jgi:eukaryotic-like serine/threonine-protein kinase